MRNGYYEENGTQLWYLNDELHREDGPAAIGTNGTQIWYLYDKCHREDGPAVISASGSKSWWVNSKYISDEVNQWLKEYNLTYETMEFEDKMALKFYIRGLSV